jgi:superfamily I DNA/RNA helicase
VCALFDLAARAEERQARRRVSAFLDEIDSQQIPGRSLAEQANRAEAVRLLTAHRAKGLEWRLVVVAGVQEGVWPDVRHRGPCWAWTG